MLKMLAIFLIYLLHTINGHTNTGKLQKDPDLSQRNDADLQAELIPQELNPEFVPGKLASLAMDAIKEPENILKADFPWKTLIPLLSRNRRDIDAVTAIQELVPGVSSNIKLYSRIASCIALALATIIEIVLYVVEYYT